MAFLIAILARELTYVIYHLFQKILVFIFFLLIELFRFYCVHFGDCYRVFLAISTVLLAFFFFLLAGFFEGLSLVLRSQCFGFLGFKPRLFYSRVFHQVVLDANFSRVGLIAAQTLLVYLFDIEDGL